MQRSRRFIAGAAALMTSVLALAGCSTSSDDPSDGGTDGEVRVVATKFGDVEVPADAEHVVALGWGDAETALALGVQPIAASDWLDFGGDGVGPWAEGMYDESPEIIGTMEPDYEKIASLEPDLILDVKSSGDEDRNTRLSQIAPTVGVPEGGDAYLTSLDQQVELIAAALGKEAEGETLLQEIDQKYEEVAAENPQFEGKTVTVAAYTSNGWGAYIEDSERMQFMLNLGFGMNEEIAALEPDGFSVDISPEQLGLLDADLIVVFPIYLPASDVTDQTVFQAIPAVQDGHAIVFEESDADIREAFSTASVLSIPYAIDNLVPRMAETVRQ